MTLKEFTSSIARSTGKFVNFGFAAKLIKIYDDKALDAALLKLKNTKKDIDNPLLYLAGILSKEANKGNSQELLNTLKLVGVDD